MNIIDRTISYFSPSTGAKRIADRRKIEIMNSGYSNHGANRSKKSMRGWNYKGGSPDEDITKELPILRERGRDLYMGSPIATGALRTYRSNIVGMGLKLKSTVDAEVLELSQEEANELERVIEREFNLWAKDCDAARKMNFYEMQGLVLLSYLMSGDVFCTLPMIQSERSPYTLRVNVIEADRVCNPPNVPEKVAVGGIKIDKFGAPIEYYVAQNHPLGSTMKNNWDTIPAFGKKSGRKNILHIMEHERPGQRRGVPILAPVMETLKQLTRYTDAELMNALISSLFTVFITSDNPDEPVGSSVSQEQKVEPESTNTVEMGPGQIISLAEGEDIKQANPSRQNNAFDGFITTLLRQVGVGLEIPHELLVKHFTSSYSASRAALLEAWSTFKMRRSFLENSFCNPIFEEFMTEAILLGRIDAPGFFDDPIKREAYLKCDWYGPSQGQLDPLKEANAAAVRVTNGFSTRSREAAELTGSDFETIVKVRVKEDEMMKEGGIMYDKQGQVLGIQELIELYEDEE